MFETPYITEVCIITYITHTHTHTTTLQYFQLALLKPPTRDRVKWVETQGLTVEEFEMIQPPSLTDIAKVEEK